MDNAKVLTDITDNVTKLSKTISDYGMFTVMLAVFVLLFFIIVLFVFINSQRQMKNIMEMNKKSADEIAVQNQKLIENLINTVSLKNDEEHHDKKSLVGTYIDINLVFRDACRTAIDRLKADRVGIYVFHNGNQSTHGLPFFKMSCIGEWVIRGSGISSRAKSHSELPLHIFSSIIERLYNDGRYYLENINTTENVDESIIEFVGKATSSIYIDGIYDNRDNLAGFILVEYGIHNTKVMDVDKIDEIIKDMNDQIKGVIIDSKIQNKLEEN